MTTPLAQMSSLQGSTFQKQKEFDISSFQDKLIVLSCAVREETQPDLFGNDCPVPNRSDSTTEHTDDTTDYTNCTKEYTDNTTEHTDNTTEHTIQWPSDIGWKKWYTNRVPIGSGTTIYSPFPQQSTGCSISQPLLLY